MDGSVIFHRFIYNILSDFYDGIYLIMSKFFLGLKGRRLLIAISYTAMKFFFHLALALLFRVILVENHIHALQIHVS